LFDIASRRHLDLFNTRWIIGNRLLGGVDSAIACTLILLGAPSGPPAAASFSRPKA
jgi:hypothetical protein